MKKKVKRNRKNVSKTILMTKSDEQFELLYCAERETKRTSGVLELKDVTITNILNWSVFVSFKQTQAWPHIVHIDLSRYQPHQNAQSIMDEGTTLRGTTEDDILCDSERLHSDFPKPEWVKQRYGVFPENELSNLGDTSTLADPSVVDDLIQNSPVAGT
jgi:hypothetical protein